MNIAEILGRGYFPKELPSPFTTESFAAFVSSSMNIGGDFGKSIYQARNSPQAKQGKYSHSRAGLLRRQLSIPNPLYQYHLSKEILTNWGALSPVIGGTPLSGTAPEYKPTGRCINGKYGQGDRANLGRKSRVGRKYILKTDISRFYHGIYTHSIPWAIHGKAAAKANRGMGLLGNRLDFWTRQGQDGQTIGIPIGPDTSLVLSEMIMQRCDQELMSKIPRVKGTRFIDDYELAFNTRTEAEEAFHVLESCLSEYELALNTKKTFVLELPEPFEASWVSTLKQKTFRGSPAGQASDLETYFDIAFQLHREHPDDSVLQYAMSRLRPLIIQPANWDLFQSLMYLCMIPEPATLPYALEQLIMRINMGFSSERNELEEIISNTIITHSSIGHSSEVANSLWAILAIGLSISREAIAALGQCDDSVAALMALNCECNNLFAFPLDNSKWMQHMSSDGLYDEHWLLAYEANVKGWLPGQSNVDHVVSDPNFSILEANGVSFYKEVHRPTATNPIPIPNIPRIVIRNTSVEDIDDPDF